MYALEYWIIDVYIACLWYNLADSDAFLTPEETSDDEETIEKEEQLMEIEVSVSHYQ